MASIDLNADLGEECADDAALLDIVTTANVAAGGHAGGGRVLEATVREAAARGVPVGAHPSYADRTEFGRVSRLAEHDRSSLAALIGAQVLDVIGACAAAGVAMTHVKAHGALYHDLAADECAAEAMLDALAALAADAGAPIAVLGPPTGILRSACERRTVRYIAEGFADRAYLPDGRLVPRSRAGAVLEDASAVVDQARSIALEGVVRTIDGGAVRLDVETLCVHGDTPGAVVLARTLRASLEVGGVRVEAPALT